MFSQIFELGKISALILRLREFVATIVRAWQDARVPLVARLCVFLGPLYLVHGSDLIPDVQPGGYCDDFSVLCALAYIGFALIPREVFRDARLAAKRAVAPTVCGAVCFSLLGLLPQAAHAMERGSAVESGVISQASSSPYLVSKRTVASPDTQHELFEVGHSQRAKSPETLLDIIRFDTGCGETRVAPLDKSPNRAKLLLWGGQAELYAVSAIAAHLDQVLVPSPLVADGIFVACKSVERKESRC